MGESVKLLCEQLISEAQTVIDCLERVDLAQKCGDRMAVDSASMFAEFAAESVEHCQKITVALTEVFFPDGGGDVEEGK